MAIDLTGVIAAEMGIRPVQVARSVELFDNDNTVPFVARYRKEVTGGLDEVQLRAILERVTYLRNLEARKATVLKSIEEQGQLSDDLRQRIESAPTLQIVEDLYLPFRPKRRTRATIARERGLEPLARIVLSQPATKTDLAVVAAPFLGEAVPTVEEAYAGARDIIAERLAEDADVRSMVRATTGDTAWLAVRQGDAGLDPRGIYRMYYDHREKLSELPPHRLLAINRGEREGALKVGLECAEETVLRKISARVVTNPPSDFRDQVQAAINDSYRRLLGPSIERQLRAECTAKADERAIQTFAANLRQLLLQPPVRGKTVMGIDPGYRTGCKVAVVDPTGKYLTGVTIYPHEPQKRWDEAKVMLLQLIVAHNVEIFSIGNGTASRETEVLVVEVIALTDAQMSDSHRIAYAMVNEAGASVYSASDLARAEFPDLDVSMRGAVSIARRLQDPLAELVKIEPRSIGVGLYQHDVDQARLTESLHGVVESAVNHVGVDVNTASPALLGYVAGINRRTAENLAKHRDENGPFDSRSALKRVKGLGEKTFLQAAGFLRISAGTQPLDNTAIHPESYAVVDRLLGELDPVGEGGALAAQAQRLRSQQGDLRDMAARLAVGEPTLVDILDALVRPGRDPRDDLPPPLLRHDVLDIADLRPGMVLNGTVRNVVDFGAFVDIGVKQDGLVHVSQMADRYVRNPFEVVRVGDVISVKVIGVDHERGRIGLSMRDVG